MQNPYRVWPVLALAAALGAFSVLRPGKPLTTPANAPTLGPIYAPPLEHTETHVLERGETLSGVLAKANLGGRELADLILALREYSNPRRLVAGSEITVRRWRSDGTTRAVEVRLNADSTVRLARDPLGWNGEVLVTPTVTDTVYASGRIEEGGSLWLAFAENDRLDMQPRERERLVGEFFNIFAYKVDFAHDTRAGDAYRVVYEREVRPDGSARSGRILVAEFTNQGKVFPAYHFSPEGDQGAYYDEKGNSLRQGFRRYPLKSVRITSHFSYNRRHPVLGINRAHLGTDFGAPVGTPVLAVADGTVQFAGWKGGYGNVVILRHINGYTTTYVHLSRFAKGIRAGRKVKQEDVIGYVGATGLATGPHLHYELRQYGKPMNPRAARNLPGGPPVPEKHRAAFAALLQERTALLARVETPGPRLASGEQAGAGEQYQGGM